MFILSFVSVGSIYLLISVGVTIYRRQHAVPLGSPIGAVASVEELESCYEELSDVSLGLERHLDNFQSLVGHYDFPDAVDASVTACDLSVRSSNSRAIQPPAISFIK